VALDRRLSKAVRELDEHELRRLLILAQGLLRDRGGPEFPAASNVTYRLEQVKCGKATCTRCPHGPYWYAYWRENGRLRSRYLGTVGPDEKKTGRRRGATRTE
jgi:hypothetical protein